MNFFLSVLALSGIVLIANAFPERSQISLSVDEPKVVKKDLQQNEEGKVSYAKNQLWKVEVDTGDKIKAIAFLRDNQALTTWGGNTTNVDVLVNPNHVSNVTMFLKQNQINYEVLIEDLQKAIDEENPPINEDTAELEDRTGHRMTWQAYHRLSDINGYLDFLATSYPNLVTVKTIGESVEGRPLKLIKISNGNEGNKAIWIDGGMHAREWISPATVTYLINYIIENFETEARAMNSIDWHILPVANPDGYEFSHIRDRLWRKNRGKNGYCVGTDLNRNFGYEWGGKGSGSQPCQEIYRGNAPFSEPESQAIRDYITQEKASWRGYLSMHSYGQYILYPWGYDDVLPPDHKELLAVGNKMAAAMRQSGGGIYKVGTASNLLYPAAGGSDDWAKGSVGIKYTYTIELRDSGRHGFILPASYIAHTAKETLAAVRVVAGAVSALYT